MGIKVTTSGQVATRVWDAQAMRQFAKSVEGAVKERTFNRGVGTDGRSFRKYSTRPMTVSNAAAEAMGIGKPRGGLPAYGRGRPRKLLTATGRARRASGWKVIGRYYPGGYAEFKRSYRRGVGNEVGAGVEVDLVLTGNMKRAFRVIRTGRTDATIGLTGEARVYGQHVDARRPFVGLSVADVRDMEAEFAAAARGAAERSARGAR